MMDKDLSHSIKEVENFWNVNPLFMGEAGCSPGTREWFLEHERVYIDDCFAGHDPDPIFTKGIQKSDRILDVGCGPGFWVRYFLRNQYQNVFACDLTEKAVELTRNSLQLFGLPETVDIRVANAENLPYASEQFNHINCQGVIHHTPNPQSCIQEFHRVLAPGGTLCFSVYHKNFILRHPWLLKVFCKFFGRMIGLKGRGRSNILSSGDPDEIVRMYDGENNPIGKAFTLRELKKMVEGFFTNNEVGYFYFPARAFPLIIPRFIHSWLHRNFGLMIIYRGEKIVKR